MVLSMRGWTNLSSQVNNPIIRSLARLQEADNMAKRALRILPTGSYGMGIKDYCRPNS